MLPGASWYTNKTSGKANIHRYCTNWGVHLTSWDELAAAFARAAGKRKPMGESTARKALLPGTPVPSRGATCSSGRKAERYSRYAKRNVFNSDSLSTTYDPGTAAGTGGIKRSVKDSTCSR